MFYNASFSVPGLKKQNQTKSSGSPDPLKSTAPTSLCLSGTPSDELELKYVWKPWEVKEQTRSLFPIPRSLGLSKRRATCPEGEAQVWGAEMHQKTDCSPPGCLLFRLWVFSHHGSLSSPFSSPPSSHRSEFHVAPGWTLLLSLTQHLHQQDEPTPPTKCLEQCLGCSVGIPGLRLSGPYVLYISCLIVWLSYASWGYSYLEYEGFQVWIWTSSTSFSSGT